MPHIDVGGGLSLFYHDEGDGEPLVLIHGFPLSSDMYRPQRAALSSRFRVITPDLRGMGRSDAPGANPTIESYADDVVALLDHLGIGQAIIGGMSMGGYVLLALLRRHPDRAKGVILIDTRAEADTDEGRANRFTMADQARAEGAAPIAEAMLPKMLTERTIRERPDLADTVREMMLATPVDGIVGALHAMAARPDSSDVLASIAVPALIIVGSDDPVTPPDVAARMHSAIHESELVIVSDAAHAANLERADIVNEAIMAWASRIR
jgi:3-oxoadipate enol-lactonase